MRTQNILKSLSIVALLTSTIPQSALAQDDLPEYMKKLIKYKKSEDQGFNPYFIDPQDLPLKILTSDDSEVTVHIVSHSHQDAGWLKTVDEYFQSDVSNIYTSVYNVLLKDSTKKYTHAEIYFFSMWWTQQNDQVKTNFRQMVKDGRWEFVNGGWVASDEACPTFIDMIENFRTGHKFLMREFGVRPQLAWHVDAFGHSMSTAQLFLDMGYDALFFARMDDKEKAYRIANGAMEFNWFPSFEDGQGNIQSSSRPLLTHNMIRHYNPPCGISLQNYFNKGSTSSMYSQQVNQYKSNPNSLINCLNDAISAYKTHNLLWIWGDDFSFYYADQNYNFMDQLISIVQGVTPKSRFNFKYSTVSEYYQAVTQEIKDKEIQMPAYYEDFMPLQQQYTDSYWTGYYSSRPNLKKLQRDLSSAAYMSGHLYAQEWFNKNADQAILAQKQQASMYINQETGASLHHDTITGTSQKYVIDYDTSKFQLAISNNTPSLQQTFSAMISQMGLNLKSSDNLVLCQSELYSQINTCPKHSDSDAFSPKSTSPAQLYAIYNPSSQDKWFTQLRFTHPNLKITYWDPISQKFTGIATEAFCINNQDANRECDVTIAMRVPSQGMIVVQVQYDEKSDISVKESEYIFIENEVVTVNYYQQKTAVVTFQITSKDGRYNQYYDFSFERYSSGASSGAYVFRSNGDSALYSHDLIDNRVFKGKYTQQIVFTYQNQKSGMKSIVRIKLKNGNLRAQYIESLKLSDSDLYKSFIRDQAQTSPYDELEYDVFFARINNNEPGQDVIVKFKALNFTSMAQTNNPFYTDSNGYGIVKRITDESKNFSTSTTQRASSNYYPINSGIYIENPQEKGAIQMVVMNDRPQGGSGYQDKSIEFMINRRGYTNDNLGMSEPINEQDSNGNGLNVSTKFIVKFTSSKQDAHEAIHRNFFQNHQDLRISYFKQTDLQSSSSSVDAQIDTYTYYRRIIEGLSQLYQLNKIQDLEFSIYKNPLQPQTQLSFSEIQLKITTIDALSNIDNLIGNAVSKHCRLHNCIEVGQKSNYCDVDQFKIEELNLDGTVDPTAKDRQRNIASLQTKLFKISRADNLIKSFLKFE
eukprot:403357903